MKPKKIVTRPSSRKLSTQLFNNVRYLMFENKVLFLIYSFIKISLRTLTCANQYLLFIVMS